MSITPQYFEIKDVGKTIKRYSYHLTTHNIFYSIICIEFEQSEIFMIIYIVPRSNMYGDLY